MITENLSDLERMSMYRARLTITRYQDRLDQSPDARVTPENDKEMQTGLFSYRIYYSCTVAFGLATVATEFDLTQNQISLIGCRSGWI